MKNIYEELLLKKDKKLYSEYTIIKELMIYTATYNFFNIPEEFFIKNILEKYLENGKVNSYSSNFLVELYQFFYKVLYHYKKGEFQKFNFLVDSFNLGTELKTWLKNSKLQIRKIIVFSLNQEKHRSSKKNLINNQFFKIDRITFSESTSFSPELWVKNHEILILMLEKGNLFFEKGFFLVENEYFILSNEQQLGKYKSFLEETILIAIHIKRKFIQEYNLNKPKINFPVKMSMSTQQIVSIFLKEMTNKNLFNLIQLISFFLMVGNSIPNLNELLIYKKFYEISELKNLKKIIEKNVTLSSKIIEEKIYKAGIDVKNIEQVNNTTLKKFINSIKLKRIIKEYLVDKKDLKVIADKYHFGSKKNIQYNLKAIYNIDIKDLVQ